MIKAGDGDIYVAGGMESMSSAPFLLPEARTGSSLWQQRSWWTAPCQDGLWCSFENQSHGPGGGVHRRQV